MTAPLVYANYGLPADYDMLSERGIDVKGKIVIARYGGSLRGIKPKVAYEHGAMGCIIYSDPRDDGYFQGDVYPKGAYRPPMACSAAACWTWRSIPAIRYLPAGLPSPDRSACLSSEAATLMKIPVIPISYGDAQPLLANLDGPVAPEAWRGALPITYHLGPGCARNVHLKVAMDNSTRPLYDVIAKIPGSEFPDQWILDGNHHDAWVHGASDPLSGAAPLMETARTLAEMTRKGWKPKRTIMLAFWDGEEFGLMGSTEWMEKHAEELDRKLVAYVNSDSSRQGPVQGRRFAFAGRVRAGSRARHQRSRDGKPLAGGAGKQNGEFRIAALGSGSDYTPFLQHLGIATLDIRFAPKMPASITPITTISTGTAISPTPHSFTAARCRRCTRPR